MLSPVMAEGVGLLITGASGFLGAHVVESARGWGVVHAQRRERPRPGGARTVDSVFDLAEVEERLDAIRPRAVVHAAALARIADAERDPELARRVNVEASARIAAR